MLKTPPRLAQDSIENPLPYPQSQPREAGSCMGAKRPQANANWRPGTNAQRSPRAIDRAAAVVLHINNRVD